MFTSPIWKLYNKNYHIPDYLSRFNKKERGKKFATWKLDCNLSFSLDSLLGLQDLTFSAYDVVMKNTSWFFRFFEKTVVYFN